MNTHVHNVTDNAAASRFELAEQGETAIANYRIHEDVITIPYVQSPVALRGQGTAGRLLEGVVAHARVRKMKIVPICGYAGSWFRRHPEHNDILK